MPKGKKTCPECQEQYGARTLKCTCGYEFRKGVLKVKILKKKDLEPVNDIVFKADEEEDDEKSEDFSRANHATKKITLSLDEEEKLNIDKLSQNTRPFNLSIDDDGKLILNGSVMIVGRGMDDCTHKSKPILPCSAVYAKIVADPKDGTLSVWVLVDSGEPDRVYLNAVA